MTEHCKADCSKVFVSWPTPQGWILIIGVLLGGVGGVMGLTWKGSAILSSLTDRVSELEKDHSIIQQTKVNSEKIMQNQAELRALLLARDR